MHMQKIMFNSPEVLHTFLDHLTEALIVYAGYQIEAGAQVGLRVMQQACGEDQIV
jgi:uroporphyrinogen-III decarboxylase